MDEASAAATGRTVDCTGYDYSFRPFDGGQRGYVACWTVPSGGKPEKGDWLLLRHGAVSTRYRVTSVDRCGTVDPPTMWLANVVFDPRTGAESREGGVQVVVTPPQVVQLLNAGAAAVQPPAADSALPDHIVSEKERMWCPMCWRYTTTRADVTQRYCPHCRWPTGDLEGQIGYRTLLFEYAAEGRPPRPVPPYTVATAPDGAFIAQPSTLEGFTPAGRALIAGDCHRRFTAVVGSDVDGFADVRGAYLDGREGVDELTGVLQLRQRESQETREWFARLRAEAEGDGPVEPGSTAAAWRRMDAAAREVATLLVEQGLADGDAYTAPTPQPGDERLRPGGQASGTAR